MNNAEANLEDPILIPCPGAGCPGNLPEGSSALCKYCNDLLVLTTDRLIPEHETVDVIAMIDRGDFGPRSVKNRSRA